VSGIGKVDRSAYLPGSRSGLTQERSGPRRVYFGTLASPCVSAPLERHNRSEALTLGASPDDCRLFGKEGRAVERRIVEVLSVA
jgi:hypothetical protein